MLRSELKAEKSQKISLDDDIDEFGEDEEPNEKDDVTFLMKLAILSDDKYSLNAAIKDGADVNALICSAEYKGSVPKNIARYRPIQHTFQDNTNYDLVKILLEHGADPNLLASANESVLELLLISIGNKISYLDKRQNKSNLEIEFNEFLLNQFKKLDLLICYGLHPIPRLSNLFRESYKELTQELSLRENIYKKRRLGYSMLSPKFAGDIIDATSNQHWLPKSIYKVFYKTAAFFTKSYLSFKGTKEKIEAIEPKNLRNYVETIKYLERSLVKADEAIKQEKSQVIFQHCQKLQGLQDNHRFNPSLISIIIEYTIDVTKEVAEARLREKRFFNFWVTVPPKNYSDAYFQKLMLHTTVLLGTLRQYMDVPNHKQYELAETVAEYAVELSGDDSRQAIDYKS